MNGFGKCVLAGATLAALGVLAMAGCNADGGGSRESDDVGAVAQAVNGPGLALVSASVPVRVVPGGSLPVSITVMNTGSTTWAAGDLKLVFQGEGAWTNATFTSTKVTKPNHPVTLAGSLGAAIQIGRFDLAWRPTLQGSAIGAPIAARTEVTCSDGVFCNGDERWVKNKCAAGSPPCDDGISCTADVCDEANGVCTRTLGVSCSACVAKNCNPSCHNLACGDDGCGGSCGTCGLGQSCVSGVCAVVTQPGTCAAPYPLLQAGEALLGKHVLQGDTSDGINQVIPTCVSTSDAREKIYTFTVGAADGAVGIDARSSGIDTVLHLRKGSCASDAATVACSDDSAPPGNYGSRVAALLDAGTYYLIVDGFDGSAMGPFTLEVTFASNCVPACDGRYCGSTDGCGGDCGLCGAGQVCNSSGRCVSSPCAPDCNGKKCGDDGCGGACGECGKGQLCVTATGACRSYQVCDHDRPVCKTACSSTEYCGSDCACHRVHDPRADLVVSRDRLANEILFENRTFSPSSCAVAEQCVSGPGDRKLLRFSVEAINQGLTTLTVPDPATRPDLFVFSPCHGHYHFQGFASYALLDLAGNVVVNGKKLAYCMEDTVQAMQGPNVACEKRFDCGNQGIQMGWSDLYGNALDCQWLDVTGVPSGDYQLSVTVNPNRAFEEGSFDNNTSVVPVTIP